MFTGPAFAAQRRSSAARRFRSRFRRSGVTSRPPMLTPGGVFRGPFAMAQRSYVASVEVADVTLDPDAEPLTLGDKATHECRADAKDA